MDQKTRVAVKYRSNVGYGYYFGVLMCVHRSRTSPSLSFHAFLRPTSRPQVHGAWIHAIRRDVGKHFKVTSNTRVCSAHFRESDYRVSAYGGTAAALSCGKGIWCSTQYLRSLSGIAACREVGGDSDDHGKPSNVPVALSSNVSDTISNMNTSPPSPSQLCSGATASVDHDYLPELSDGNPLPPHVLGHIPKLAKENTSLREELASAKRKTITIESVKQNDNKFSACSGLPNYDAFEVLCDHLGPKAKAPGLRWWRGKPG